MEYNLKKLVNSMFEHRKNRNFEKNGMRTSYQGLSVKASIGMTGNISIIPWISYCAEGQSTHKGIYPVLLFYGTPEFINENTNKNVVKKIVLAYGISATNKPQMTWGSEVDGKMTIKEAFKEWNYETKKATIKKYNSSYVYKVYDWTDDINYKKIQEDLDCLINIYTSIIKKSKKYKPIEEPSVPNVSEPNTPERDVIPPENKSLYVILEEAYKGINESLPDKILDKVKQINPKSFEKLVRDLIAKIMKVESSKDVVNTQYSKDGGIDGYINSDAFGIKKLCCFQAKRWDNSVGVKIVRELVGALVEMKCDTGIVVTTSNFSRDAIDYNPSGYKIILIDGKKLAELMIGSGIGITEKKYTVKDIDINYLDNL